jgi:hypothetical protein
VRLAEKRYISRVDSREKIAAAHEKIAQLETHLATLRRGFDPPPLTNAISEGQHRELRSSRSPGVKRVAVWAAALAGTALVMAVLFLAAAILALIFYFLRS